AAAGAARNRALARRGACNCTDRSVQLGRRSPNAARIGSGAAVPYDAVDDGERHRQLEQLVGVELDGVFGERAEIGAIALADPAVQVALADELGRVEGVAEQRLEPGQRLLRPVGAALRVARLAPKPAPAHATARVEPRD